MKKHLVAAGMVALVASVQTASAEKFDLQSVFGLQVPSIGPSPQKWAEKVELMTGGDVEIDVHGAGEFVPPFEVFDAVSSGAIPMGFDWIGYWAEKIPVANLVGSMPFGPTPDVALAWMFKGGGLEIIQKAYDPFNVKVLPCHLVVPEAGGWFNKEITSPDDLVGYTPEREVVKREAERWNMTQAKTLSKLSHQHRAIIDDAKIEGTPKIKIEPRKGDR